MPNPPVQIEPEENKFSAALAERMDPAIGEATSVMGAVVTEMLRRTLRGGVQRIGEELHAFVAEKVDATIAERTPAIEQAATEVAQNAARVAATEVAYEEVKALEKRTQEGDQHLAARIEETARTVEKTTQEKAQELASRIETAQKKAEEITEAKARELASQIETTEKRVTEYTRAEVQDLLQRSRDATNQVKGRLQTLEAHTDELHKHHDALRSQLTQSSEQFHSTLQQHLADLRREMARVHEEHQARLHHELAAVREVHETLHARLAELEKPRGIRAMFGKMFGRGKKSASESPAELSGDEPEAGVTES